ncbi:protein FAR1-RELATED SEQUENCE 5-like [Silene latifolia]|uniref:protein FAR1-RELATED SEQUENCE 5-like n=1 Tax=Silene latifolia TaxID=37657 RepID=UPI003D78289E
MALDFDLNNLYEEGECSRAAETKGNDEAEYNSDVDLMKEYVELYGDGPVDDDDTVWLQQVIRRTQTFAHSYAYKKGFSWYIRTNKLFKKYKEDGVSKKGSFKNEPRYHMYERLRLCCVHAAKTKDACNVYIESRYFDDEDVVKITQCHLEHNHDMDPKKSRLFVGFRHINDYFKKRMMINDAAGISILNNYKSLVLEGGGHENLGFKFSDSRNAINQERRRSVIDGDAKELKAYFEKMEEEDPNYFYAIELDDFEAPMNVFLVYRMPFSTFIGVNQHGNSIVFACALVTRDYEESFEWVFAKFLECMGKAPSVILTDQERAIGNVIKKIFPNTHHRLCLWHILKNAGKNLGKHPLWNDISSDLNLAVHDSLEVHDFEIAWKEMVHKYGIEKCPWVIESYLIRESWVPAYWRGIFCAGMSSTQRSEQQNRYFKSYVNGRTTLSHFAKKIEETLKLKVEEETANNHDCTEKPYKIECNLLVEQVFHKLYTKKIYKLVRDEVIGLIYTNVDPPRRLGHSVTFNVEDKKVAPFGKCKNYWVDIDRSVGLLKYSCKLFEFKGILCRHIIRCMVIEDVKVIPEKYILDRWRKDLVREYETIKTGYYNPEASARAKKSLEVTIRNHYISTLALRDDETYATYDRLTSELIKELEGIVGVETIDAYVPGGVSSRKKTNVPNPFTANESNHLNTACSEFGASQSTPTRQFGASQCTLRGASLGSIQPSFPIASWQDVGDDKVLARTNSECR